jgi:hypothetical protein
VRSGQRMMGVGGVVKPVSAPPHVATDAFYNASITAPSHRRRAAATVMPPCHWELRRRRLVQGREECRHMAARGGWPASDQHLSSNSKG